MLVVEVELILKYFAYCNLYFFFFCIKDWSSDYFLPELVDWFVFKEHFFFFFLPKLINFLDKKKKQLTGKASNLMKNDKMIIKIILD